MSRRRPSTIELQLDSSRLHQCRPDSTDQPHLHHPFFPWADHEPPFSRHPRSIPPICSAPQQPHDPAAPASQRPAIISHPSSDDVHGKSSSAHHHRLRAGISDLGSEIQPTTSRSPNQKANSNSDPTTTPRAARENSRRQVHHTQLH
ncbi:hypothetical protein ACLOJK_034729 [Asimina triloba]